MATQYFGNNQRGELQELYQDLNDLNFEKKKDAVKKVIAYMTVGKDVSQLFQCVIKCLEYNDIELKKLIYLYIINYSRQRPDDAIMVIQLFRKDVKKTENPLVRALAVRTFGCLRVPKLNDYLVEPLKECLNDEDPYVRKTAVLCVPKVFEVTPDIVISNGLIEIMQKLLEKESNSLVVANLIQSLSEIGYMNRNEQLIQLQTNSLQKVLLALNECIEWGQIFILDFLGYYNPKTSNETEIIIERILPRLSHINPTVVFAACKVILKYLDFLDNGDLVRNLCKKLSPSLISLLSWNQSEVQYTILRNIGIIIQKFPVLFENNVKVFFCSFNDPYFLKYEKLDIMVKICDKNNNLQVITELGLYINEADPEFVRRSIKALGKIGLEFDKAAEKVISILTEFAQNSIQNNRGDLSIQEILVQIMNLYRKNRNLAFQDKSLQVIVQLEEFAIESQAKAACAWILGEFGEYIKNAGERLKLLVDSFISEERNVQLQILTACVKLFLKFPNDHEQLITHLLTQSTESFNPDVRDRGYIYWRLLSTDPERTKRLVCSDSTAGPVMEKNLWDNKELYILLENLGSISNLFQKLPERKQMKEQKSVEEVKPQPQQQPQTQPQTQAQTQPQPQPQAKPQPQTQQQSQGINLLDLDDEPQQQQSQQQQQQKQKQQESFDLI